MYSIGVDIMIFYSSFRSSRTPALPAPAGFALLPFSPPLAATGYLSLSLSLSPFPSPSPFHMAAGASLA